MGKNKKITGLLAAAIGISVLALAGKQVADKYARHTEKKIDKAALPPAKDEYTKLVQKFMQTDSATVSAGTITLYDGEHTGEVKEKSDFISIRDGRSFYSKMSYVEMMYNGKYFAQTDSLHKVLLVAGVNESLPAAPATPEMGGMFDRLFSDTASFKVSGMVEGDELERTITIRSDFNPEIQFFTLRYSPADYSIKGAEIRFWKNRMPETDSTAAKEKVWISKIEYRKVGPSERPDVNKRMSRIFSVKNNTVVPSRAYQDYRIMVK